MLGIIMAFQKFNPMRGILKSPWVGLDNFKYMFLMPDTLQVIWNTFFIAVMKIVLGIIVPIIFALLINELRSRRLKRVVQSTLYLPHFLSWVILSGIMIDILSPSKGIVNQVLQVFGIEPIFFLGNPDAFPFVMVGSELWKELGFSTIIYLASLTGVDPTLYEASIVDGANRWKQTWHITLPGIASTVVVISVLSIGNILNAGFEQIFNLYNPAVYRTGDIIDTLVYRIGVENREYSLATAVGLFKSVVSFVLIATSYIIAKKVAKYRIF
jgi:putative aldouronate transport system permease protein